tara:strand:+ start:1850 stop:4096 length:2247 start_codon:yes stop_codon:yes gene_type:complete
MIINKRIDEFIIDNKMSIKTALKKIDDSNNQIIFAVDKSKRITGVLTDGDIRRWLINSENPDLEQQINSIAKKDFTSASIDLSPNEISDLINSRIRTIPLINKKNQVVAIAESKSEKVIIGNKTISDQSPAFIIAEIGNNHQGNLDLAKKLIDQSIEAGVDCVKFQMRSMDQLYKNRGNSKDISADLGDQYTLDLLSKFQLSNEDLFSAFDYCKEMGTIPLCTPWDLESLRILEEYGMDAYKIASADFTNYEILEAAAVTHKPLICSTGMSNELEITKSSRFLSSLGAQCIFLHCNSTYPTPYKDINLKYLNHLKELTGSLVGYSGHERGHIVALAAISMGAKVIEKHVTLDKSLEGNDHKVSLTPDEFKEFVNSARDIEEALGNSSPREITQGELLNREVLAKSLIAKNKIKKGNKIKRENIDIKSPGQGIQPNRIDELVGRVAQRDFEQGDFFFESDLKKPIKRKSFYEFNRPFGIPVRYHDFKSLTEEINIDFMEFHLSYQDLRENPLDYIDENQKCGFSVHTPELFENDHILDLCSLNDEYREISKRHFKEVLEHIMLISKRFKKTKKPILILNAGGWDKDNFIENKEKGIKYKILKESLEAFDLSDVELSIQTMPPFPWHFGGQSHHNLFVDPNEIQQFCSETGFNVCLDVSHSAMACSYYGWDLIEFTKKISPHINYFHIVDAKGSDGEGVEIGKGDVDFELFSNLINKECKNIPFIPEVWQGHKDKGAGFYNALNFLEKYL